MRSISSKYIGIITGIAMVLVSLLMFYVLKFPAFGEGQRQYFVWTVYVAGIICSLVAFKAKPGEHSFKEYFSEGFKTFIVAALIIVVYSFIFHKLNPQILEKAIADNNAMAIKEGTHTAPEIADNAEKLRKIFIVGILMTNTVIYLLLGSLVSMIGGGILSQKKDYAQ